MHKIFEHYNTLIPKKNQWEVVCAQPLPTCFWVNTLKTTANTLQHYLQKDGYALTPLHWNPNAFRCVTMSPDITSLGKRWEYVAGLFQIQEEVSMLPVNFLNPQPGERVLDLCAAPGNKTAQIAVQLNNSGTVIANDKHFQRMRAFGQISKRLGLINVSTTIDDGRHYRRLPNYFDKVLVDAPCSGEGTCRKGHGKDIPPNLKNSLRLQRIQIALLKKAIQLCRPGGRIVYSTCTFAPEENEAVIDAIVKEHDALSVKPIHLDNFQLTPGVTEWQNTIYNPAVKHTARVWPHLNNTGGFFIAVLEKLEKSGESTTHSSIQEKTTINKNIQSQLDALHQRFAIPKSVLARYRYLDDNYRGIYLTNADNAPPADLKIDATGLFFLKTRIQYPKLSTAAAMLFGQHAKQNSIALTPEQRDDYLQKKDFPLTQKQAQRCTDTGYVIVNYVDYPLGVGLYFEARDDRGPMLRSLFPKYLR